MTRRHHPLIVILGIAAAVLLSAVPARAAEPADVAGAIRDDGVFVEAGSDLSEADAGELVATVRNLGERFSIVVLAEDPGSGAVTFGDAVVDRLSDPGLIFVLTPDDVAVVGEGAVFTLEEIDAALDAAIEAGGSDAEYAANFVEALTGQPVAVTPEPTTAPEPASTGSSGGGAGFLWFLVIVAGIGLFIFFMIRRSRARQEAATANELTAARAEIQHQLDAVANDILDMEDEVRSADNDRVDELYNEAGETYRDGSEALAGADSPEGLLAIANAVDVAVWQLDSVEALLDGKQPPPRPEPKRLEPATSPVPAPGSGAGAGPLGVPPRPTSADGGYDRRDSRRSGGFSPSLLEMLIALGAGAVANRARTPRFPTSRSTPPGSSSGSGGGFLPSPSRRGTTSGGGSTSRRGTGGRIRTGRKRRR